ncbi:MAG: hypothetical protein ACFFDI_33150 [Promethearchaeota archaeon]
MSTQLFHEYLKSVTDFLEKNYIDKVVSIVLFGSLVNEKKQFKFGSTDVDLLIILKDSCPTRDCQRIKQRLAGFETKYFSYLCESELSFFSLGLQRATGMFVNFFLCRFSDFKNRNIKVFNVNPLMGRLLAPQDSLWLSLLRHHRIIWGKNVFQEWKTLPTLKTSDLIRSFLMNWILATGALFLYPFFPPQFAKFSMEAMKWSLFTWRNFYHQATGSLLRIITKFVKKASTTELRALRCFINYREDHTYNSRFPYLAWLFVFQLHRSLFRHYYG